MTKQWTRKLILFCLGIVFIQSPLMAGSIPQKYDVIVYGGTVAGVMAAIAARQAGATVLLLSPAEHIGGVTSGGLGWTDIGNPDVIGGLAREFYHHIFLYYQNDSVWKSGSRQDYESRLHGNYQVKDSLMWTFEPHVAEYVLNLMLNQNQVSVKKSVKLDRKHRPEMRGGKIISIQSVGGNRYSAEEFIDASYEGDLMAMVGVSFTVGREANAQYGETINGIERKLTVKNILPAGVDPYNVEGDKSSGLLPGIQTKIDGPDGSRDDRLQAYCYRMCLTDDPSNRISVFKPANYNPSDFELVIRATLLGERRLWKLSKLPNRKIDANNDCGISMDAIGYNKGYVKASYQERREIADRHRYWTLGLIWTVQNDPRVPSRIRQKFGSWGLPKDEFKDNDHFPYALYVREARRMVSDYVMTEKEVLNRGAENAIAMGSYVMDSHNTQRYVNENGDVQNEGDVQIPVKTPYPIGYGAITPKISECKNLLVPVCLSASHVAFGSIRMEPVFMVLGESAGVAAAMAAQKKQAVQLVNYHDLKKTLIKRGQILEFEDMDK